MRSIGKAWIVLSFVVLPAVLDLVFEFLPIIVTLLSFAFFAWFFLKFFLKISSRWIALGDRKKVTLET